MYFFVWNYWERERIKLSFFEKFTKFYSLFVFFANFFLFWRLFKIMKNNITNLCFSLINLCKKDSILSKYFFMVYSKWLILESYKKLFFTRNSINKTYKHTNIVFLTVSKVKLLFFWLSEKQIYFFSYPFVTKYFEILSIFLTNLRRSQIIICSPTYTFSVR